MLWNPPAASVLSVPGKSLPIISRTGHVWHPIGRPSGLARSSTAPAESRPATAACFAVVFKKPLLVIVDICSSKEAYKIHQFRSNPSKQDSSSRGAARSGLHDAPGNNINLEYGIGCREISRGEAQFASHNVAALSDGAGFVEGNFAVASLAAEAAVA